MTLILLFAVLMSVKVFFYQEPYYSMFGYQVLGVGIGTIKSGKKPQTKRSILSLKVVSAKTFYLHGHWRAYHFYLEINGQ